jgi:hypothetical protein
VERGCKDWVEKIGGGMGERKKKDRGKGRYKYLILFKCNQL